MNSNKIFDTLKKKTEQHNNNKNDEGLNENIGEKIEIINIDEKVFQQTNIMQEQNDEHAEIKEDIMYENIKSFKNMDIKTFIQQTLDYYSSNQLNKNDNFLEQNGYNNINSKSDDTTNEVENKYSSEIYKNNEQSSKENDYKNGKNNIYDEMTPAQRFYEENKDKLMNECMKYYNERNEKINKNNENIENPNIYYDETYENDYYNSIRDPIVRPKDNYLFDYENEDENGEENEDLELEKGIMPTIEQVVCILKHEKVKNIKVIDLNKCGRRDIGMFLILCTGNTAKHNKKVGKLISKIFIDLEIPYISNIIYCYCNKSDDWIISHCGPLKIHIVTKELRDKYDIENLFLYPHEHFDNSNFPSFFDYTPGIPPPYIVRSNSTLDSYHNDNLYQKFIADV
ncbi:ribosomal silencing factor RsfS, putative [Plasmodium vinckei brucechwatti]|uniref:Ribosomal silencing factor RsfS, putative n=1 Tax=Plasmodium vinckei brucechwatti TaxID=119398 RepID=A0A6V7RWJ5_PLAVN|nr:ribosomal silencing factor RsfS, putative [Plasmodium vinckei brucechwatti]